MIDILKFVRPKHNKPKHIHGSFSAPPSRNARDLRRVKSNKIIKVLRIACYEMIRPISPFLLALIIRMIINQGFSIDFIKVYSFTMPIALYIWINVPRTYNVVSGENKNFICFILIAPSIILTICFAAGVIIDANGVSDSTTDLVRLLAFIVGVTSLAINGFINDYHNAREV